MPTDEEVVISVTDQGCGISAEDIPHVFDRFYRCDQSRNLPGNGLGLSLVDAIVRAHGGRCVLKSCLNEGTECSVILKKNI